MPLTKRPYFKWIPIERIQIDPRYQRPVRDGHVKQMAQSYDDRLTGCLYISLREDGTHFCFQGQHRYLMLLEVGERRAPCLIYEGLTVEEEAEVFELQHENSAPLTLHDIWKSQLFRGVEPTTTINTIVEEEGYIVSPSAYASSIAAIVALRKTYKRGGSEHLRLVLQLIKPWKGMALANSGQIIDGLSLFLKTVKPGLSLKRLEDTLKKADPAVISVRAASRQRNLGGTGSGRTLHVRDQILELYNSRLKHRLYLVGDEVEDDEVEVEAEAEAESLMG